MKTKMKKPKMSKCSFLDCSETFLIRTWKDFDPFPFTGLVKPPDRYIFDVLKSVSGIMDLEEINKKLSKELTVQRDKVSTCSYLIFYPI